MIYDTCQITWIDQIDKQIHLMEVCISIFLVPTKMVYYCSIGKKIECVRLIQK